MASSLYKVTHEQGVQLHSFNFWALLTRLGVTLLHCKYHLRSGDLGGRTMFLIREYVLPSHPHALGQDGQF